MGGLAPAMRQHFWGGGCGGGGGGGGLRVAFVLSPASNNIHCMSKWHKVSDLIGVERSNKKETWTTVHSPQCERCAHVFDRQVDT